MARCGETEWLQMTTAAMTGLINNLGCDVPVEGVNRNDDVKKKKKIIWKHLVSHGGERRP